MSVPGSTDKVKNANVAPPNPGNVSPKQVKEFNEAINRSTTSNNASSTQYSKGNGGSQHSQNTSNSLPIILATRPPINLAQPKGKQGAPGVGSNAGQQAAGPAKPGKPLDLAQMEAMNRRVQAFNVKGS